MAKYTQANRALAITTPLGADALLLEKFTGTEALSELYRFELDLLAEKGTAVPFDALLGQKVTLVIRRGNGEEARYFNGIVNSLSQGPQVRGPELDTFVRYQAEVVPELWLLAKRVQSRIFQSISIPDILKQVLKDEWQLDVSLRIQGPFYPRDFCVQYRESDFAFVSRLMEEEGIYHFFEHRPDGHQLILANVPRAHPVLPQAGSVRFEERTTERARQNRVHYWFKTQKLRAGKVTLWDHCFELPHQHLEAQDTVQGRSVSAGRMVHALQAGGNQRLELFDYPGGYAQRFDGVNPGGDERPDELRRIYEDNVRTAAIRLEEETWPGLVATGAGTCWHFAPGYRFTLQGHYDADGPYVLTRVRHSASIAGTYLTGQKHTELVYENEFQCIPVELPFRPLRVTPRPKIEGTQTAVVAGPPGEEIFVDKYGRVKVQFHWDRQGKNDAGSSCWVRVAQVWAGKTWGAFFWPRTGHEVVVAFEEADPDRPIIIGSVYNAENMPPYLLPGGSRLGGIKSCTVGASPASRFNGIVLQDVKGHEELTLHTRGDLHLSCDENLIYNVGGHLHTMTTNTNFDRVGSLPKLIGGGSPPPHKPPASPPPPPPPPPPAKPPPPSTSTAYGQTVVEKPSDTDENDLTYDSGSNWNYANKTKGTAVSFGPTIAFKSTYGVDGKAFFGFGPSFSFGSSWKMAVNPIGLLGELAEGSTSVGMLVTLAQALPGLFGGDIGFTVGAGTKFAYGPSYAFAHGRDIKFIPSKDHSPKDGVALTSLQTECKVLANLLSLSTMALILTWSTDAPDRIGNAQKDASYALIALNALLGGLLFRAEYATYYAYYLLKEKDKNKVAAACATAADNPAKRNILKRFLKKGIDDVKSETKEFLKKDPDVTANKLRAKQATATTGDWEVKAGGITLTAVDETPGVYLQALTNPELELEPKGQVSILADDAVSITAGRTGVVIHNADPDGKICLGGKPMLGEITLAQGLKKVVLDKTSVTVDGGGTAAVKVTNARAVNIEALQSITLKVGESSIKVDNLGVEINGSLFVDLKADLEVQQKALSIRINSDAVFDQQSGIFKAV